MRSFATSHLAYDTGSQHSKTSKESYKNPIVAAKEQKAVFLARLLVFGVLLIALAAVAITMYWVVVANERSEFETQVRQQEGSC